MGNYYTYESPPCEVCGRSDEPIHIGHEATGWTFALHVIPERGLNTLADWQRFLDGKIIEDEHGRALLFSEMMSIIMQRSHNRSWDKAPNGYGDWLDFHMANQSQRGPNGLLRYRIGRHCIGHGNGTWDLVKGEFC